MQFTIERTEQFLSIIKATIEQKPIFIKDIEYTEEYDGKDFKPFKFGSYWGGSDLRFRFRTQFTIPQEYDGETVKCRLKTGRENKWNSLNPQFLLYINGKIIQGLDTNHQTFLLSKSAKAGDRYDIVFDAYSGREQNNEQSLKDSPLQFELNAYVNNEDARQLYYDIDVARQAAVMYPADNAYRVNIENYLTAAINLLDCRIPSSEEYFASVREARRYMQEEFYGKYCGDKSVIADCVGHTHIDVAWLWTYRQTREKAVHSFATELMLLEEYPEHKFSPSQPQLYQFVKEDAPGIYEKVKQYVKEGRWEPQGAMWLEADCNLTSGESLIRQIVHGKRFMREEFNKESRVLWLPDVFGYSAALPQIMKKTGVDTFVTSKIFWNETNRFPYDTFMWQGIDGTEIFTQFIMGGYDGGCKLGKENPFSTTYNSELGTVGLAKGWEYYKQKDINNELLISFGYGDGGGGVSEKMLENNRRISQGIPGTPASRITTIRDTIDRIRKNISGKKVPKWFGELYLELHRGTYTSIAKNKRSNRKSEFLLQHTESVSLINKLLLGGAYDKQAIYDSWTTVLLNQFHDVLPGSSIEDVYKDTDAMYKSLTEENTARSGKALASIAANVSERGIFVYNPTGIKQSGVVNVSGSDYFAKDVKPYGWKVINSDTATAASPVVSAAHMENDFFVLDLNEKAQFTRIYDKKNDREVLPAGERGNILRAFDDHPKSYDDWEITNYYNEKMWEIDEVVSIEPVDCTAAKASLRVEYKFLNSTLTQKITIYRDTPRIDFDTEADWNDHHILLKAAFPVDVLSDKATFEIQYGSLERPTHSNTSWDAAKFEVCAHKWMDYSEPGYGVAMLNDCKYGCDIHDGVMSLSLLKCGSYPNPIADIGHHKFAYSIMPHSGDWRDAEVANEAYVFNCPLMACETEGKGTLPAEYSFVAADDADIFITTAKESDDGEDIVLRMYESRGKRTKTTVNCGFDIASVKETDMLETETYADTAHDGNTFKAEFRPYEIKTFRITANK